MTKDNIAQRVERIKAVKSAFILEARRLSEQGLEAFARPFFQEAAQGEIALAELFESMDRQEDANISLLSAGSCLVKARQFQTAAEILKRISQIFPEARRMLDQCDGKNDEPLVADLPELRALINLLLKKGLVTEQEWAEALKASIPG